jgi:hypothetical protein
VTDVYFLTPRIGIPKEFIPSLVAAKVDTDSLGMDIDQSGLTMWHWRRGFSGCCLLTDAAGVTKPADLTGLEFLPLFHEHVEAVSSVSKLPRQEWFPADFGTISGTTNDSRFRGDAGDENHWHCWVPGRAGERVRVPVSNKAIVYLREKLVEDGLIQNWKLLIPRGGSGGREGTGTLYLGEPGDVMRAGDLLLNVQPTREDRDKFAEYFNSTPVQYLIHALADGQNLTQKTLGAIPKPDLSQPQTNSDIYRRWGWSDELIHHAENTKLIRSIAKFDGPDKQS